jgi:hypothetical protein
MNSTVFTSCREGKDEIILEREDQLHMKEKNNTSQ